MQEKQLLQEIDAFIAENKQNVLRDIKTLVDIPSVEAAALPDAPFGAAVQQALEAALNMADGMGLHTHNAEGYLGYADLVGKSETQLAIITHLDVVPMGNGWTHDPFDMIEKDGYILGRGVADDKGPAVLTLYAAKFFAQKGEMLPYTLRLLFGTNEESGMGGLAYYQKHYENPAFCFTPDAEFPVCYGEKGLYEGNFTSGVLQGNLVEFTGGVASNVVPDRASALVKADITQLHSTENVTITAQGEGLVRVAGFGKGGHAAMPHGTVNAIDLVVTYLLDNALCSAQENEFLQFLHTLLSTTDGSSMGIAAQDDIFDPLTCIGGTIKLENGVLTQNINIRFPTSITAEKITQTFSTAVEKVGGKYQSERENVPFVTDPNTPVVQTLIQSYNDVTGKNETPFTMGGGTYARHFPCAVSFGPEEPGETAPAWVGPMHGADEGMSIELLWKALKVYIVSIHRLMQLEL